MNAIIRCGLCDIWFENLHDLYEHTGTFEHLERLIRLDLRPLFGDMAEEDKVRMAADMKASLIAWTLCGNQVEGASNETRR